MAYFSNSTCREVFDEQCIKCKYGQHPCPIAWVQNKYNYKAVNNKIATEILYELVRDDGTCTFWEMAKKDLFVDINQMELFTGVPG